MKAAARSRRDRIRAQLADLKMPGALEAIDDVLTGVDGGGVTASEAIETLLEAERGGLVGLELFLEGGGHRAELHGVELVEGLLGQHRSSPVVVVAW